MQIPAKTHSILGRLLLLHPSLHSREVFLLPFSVDCSGSGSCNVVVRRRRRQRRWCHARVMQRSCLPVLRRRRIIAFSYYWCWISTAAVSAFTIHPHPHFHPTMMLVQIHSSLPAASDHHYHSQLFHLNPSSSSSAAVLLPLPLQWWLAGEEEEGSVVAVSIEKSYSVSHGILPLSSTSSSSAEWNDKTLRSRCASLSSSASHHHIRVISNAVAVREKCRCPFRYIHILLLPAEQDQGTDRRAKRTE